MVEASLDEITTGITELSRLALTGSDEAIHTLVSVPWIESENPARSTDNDKILERSLP